MKKRFSRSGALCGGAAAVSLTTLAAVASPLVPGPAHTAATFVARRETTAPRVKFEDYRLKNGLRVLLAPDKSAPVVSVAVTYNVGSRDEKPGRTGFAHLFEHMMFEGSANVGRGEHMQLINDNGGSLNGTTNQDRTNYFETLPANQLEMGLFLEADRMRALDVTQANLDNQREVVKEEKRQSYDNRPGGGLQDALLANSYESFSYKHSTIGSMDDLNAATLDDVRAFFKTYYAPNNAVLAIAGDFDTKKARALIEKYFGSIPAQPAPPPVVVNERLHRGERRATLKDPLLNQRRYVQAYVTVPGDHPDFPALSVLGTILGGGRTSRLYGPLTEARKANNFGAGVSEGRGPELFEVNATPSRPVAIEELEKIIDAEIARIAGNGVTADELRRAKRQAQVGQVARLQTSLARARSLSQNAVYFNDPNRINTYAERIARVTADDVKQVAASYLTPDNRTVIVIEPTNPEAARPGRADEEVN